jgi:hypothetical protein
MCRTVRLVVDGAPASPVPAMVRSPERWNPLDLGREMSTRGGSGPRSLSVPAGAVHDEVVKIRTAPFLVVAVVASVLLASCGGSSDGPAASTTAKTTTTVSSTTTTKPSATTTSSVPDAGQPEQAVWPFASTDTRFSDPAAAAKAFATDYLGFVDPVVGSFQQGDARSGEVAIRPQSSGPVTTVLVRQLTADGSWWVIGAATDNIQLTSPEAMAAITSPVVMSGTSTAFEATVDVEVRQDDTMEPLAKDFVMGGSMGTMGPFSKEIAFGPQSADAGAVVLTTHSAEDGSIWEATVVRVSFGG